MCARVPRIPKLNPRKPLFLIVAILVVQGLSLAAFDAQHRSTTNAARWVDKGTVPSTNWATTASYVEVFPDSLYQVVDGFGGCFNERGWKYLSMLSTAGRDSVIKALFDSATGCNFRVCRMPIGSNDYSLSSYSLNDSAGDYDMSAFSLTRDRTWLIPYIKEAMKYQPNLKVWGSPWSPPTWMKANKSVSGEEGTNRLVNDSRTLTAYALYLSKVVTAFQAEGVNLYAVHVQNEQELSGSYETCYWPPAMMLDFIKNYLGPRFQQDRIPGEIFHGTMVVADFDEYIRPIFADPDASKYLAGVGLQWMADQQSRDMHAAFPSKKIVQTESTCCGYEPNGSWAYGVQIFSQCALWMNSWANVYSQWNMALEPDGQSSVGWTQQMMVIVNPTTKAVTYTPSYYAVKHFSHYVQPGARRIKAAATSWGGSEFSAFRNPGGDVVLAVSNTQSSERQLTVRLGTQMVKATLPGNSFNTVLMKAASNPVSVASRTVVPADRVSWTLAAGRLTIRLSGASQGARISIHDVRGATLYAAGLRTVGSEGAAVVDFGRLPTGSGQVLCRIRARNIDTGFLVSLP